MTEKNGQKIDLLRYIEEVLVGSLFIVLRMFKTTKVFLFNSNEFVDYLSSESTKVEYSKILYHHENIIRPMTFAALCAALFFFIAVILGGAVESGIHGLPYIKLPDYEEANKLAKALASISLNHFLILFFPYMLGIAFSGIISKLLVFGRTDRFKYLTAIYLCCYFFGVCLLIAATGIILWVIIIYIFFGLNAAEIIKNIALYVYIAIFAIWLIASIIAFTRICLYISYFTKYPWNRCLASATSVSITLVLSLLVGFSFANLGAS